MLFRSHDVAFMIIDYKGGGMSNALAGLPHLVATLTNLESDGLLDRAKISLKAELERRQRLFAEAGGVQHIDEYYASPMRETEPLPHLMIVIDEFAQLKAEKPEFMDEMIRIASIGRTLGVHLLLATQKPAGTVDEKIWSNARFRICFRVQDESDSREMLKRPDAAWLTNPGRGYLQVGAGELFELVQFAWSGAPYEPEPDGRGGGAGARLARVELDGARTALEADERRPAGAPPDRAAGRPPRKELQALIERLAQEAETLGIRKLPGPWTPPLPERLFLEDASPPSFGGWNGRGWTASDEWLNPTDRKSVV